jgi:hypothetical protein
LATTRRGLRGDARVITLALPLSLQRDDGFFIVMALEELN